MTPLSRSALAGTTIAGLALTLSACGGGEAKTLETADSTPTPTPTPTADPAEVAADWLSDLDALVATGTSPAQKAAAISGGDDLTKTFKQLAGAIKGFKITFKVKHPEITDATGKADVLVISNGKPFDQTYPAFFEKVGDQWQLNRAGACSLIALSGVTCPEA